MFEKPARRIPHVLTWLVAAGSLAAGPVEAQERPEQRKSEPGASLDATRIRTGEMKYVMLLQGSKFGELSWVVVPGEDGSYSVTEQTSGAAGHGRSSYAFTRDFIPLSASQEGTLGNMRAVLELEYAGPWIRGRATLPLEGETLGAEDPRMEDIVVDTLVAPGTLDEQMGLAAVMASSLRAGQHLEFPIFSPRSGVTRFRAKVTEEVSVKVPAGVFEAYRIEVSYDETALVVYMTRETPRLLVKEELGGGAVTIELEATGG